jgi:DNA-binding NtrC family response regulator
MPSRIVVVHDDPGFRKALVDNLGGADVRSFDDPIRALTLLKSANSVEFLITRLNFARQPIGLSLARATRAARPDVRVIFTGNQEHRVVARGLGEFLEEPVSVSQIGMLVEWLRVTQPD